MKNLSFLQRSFFKLLIVFSLLFHANFISGQACDQLEILFTEPECYVEKHQSPGGTGPDRGCQEVSACENQPYTYISSITGLGYTYNWVATGPTSVAFFPNNSSQQVSIVWPVVGNYTLILTVTDNLGNVFTKCLTINVKEKPIAAFTFSPDNQCAGSMIQFTNGSTYSGGGMIYNWNFDDPTSNTNYSSATSPTHQFNNPGTYDVTLIVSSFQMVIVSGSQGNQEQSVQKVCCSDTVVHKVTIVPGTIKIDCITTMCANEISTYTAVGCATPTWSTPIGGSIIGASGNTVTVQWGNGAIQGQLTATCGTGCPATVQIPIIPAVPVALGNLSPCFTSIESYNLPVLPGTGYQWTLLELPSGINKTSSVYTFPDNNTAWVNWATVTGGVYTPGNTYQLGVTLLNRHNCCGPVTNSITITPKETFAAFFDQEVCLGGTASLSTFPTYGTFSWSVLPVAGVSPISGGSSAFNPTFSISGDYVATVNETANSYCNSPGAKTVKITVLPATPSPGTIVGPATVCLTDILPYSMSTNAPSGYHYNWSITGGTGTFEPGAMATTNGDGVNIKWTTVPGTISVFLERNSFPTCPSAPVTFNVTQATTGSVTGTPNVCVDSNGSYTLSGGTVPPGTTVTWSITPAGIGTIIAGQGTTNVTIKWHGDANPSPWAATVNATTTCGVATPFNITIYPKFAFTLSQNASDICQPTGVTLTASTVLHSPTYLWSNLSTTNPTSVFSAGTYYLTVTNAGGCTATNKIEVIDPFSVNSSCTVGVCSGAGMQEVLTVSASAPGAPGTITYQWFTGVSPGGTPILGSTTNTYTATVGGNYYVEVYYGTCTKTIIFNIEQVCCPDVNKPTVTAVQNSCFDFTFTSTSLVAGKPYTLYFGDGTSTSGTTSIAPFINNHTYATAGVYCVKLRIDNGVCGVNWAATSVIVPIKAQFFYNLACNGCVNITNLSINLSSPSFVTYDWDFGDGFMSLGNTTPAPPAHCYTVAGSYVLKLTMKFNNGSFSCSDIYSLPIIYTPLSINLVPSPICTDNLISYSSNSGSSILTFYTWDFGDSYVAFTPTTAHTYTTATTYTVGLTVTDELGTVCTASTPITVLPGFAASLAPGFICPGGSAILTPIITGPPGTYTYAWQELIGVNWVPAGGVNNASTYSTLVPGTFRVVITAPNGCTVETNLVPVINVPAPVAKISVSPSKKLCFPGGLITLNSDNHLAGYTSQWYVGSIAPANEILGSPAQSVSLFVSTSDNYYLVLTNQYGCKDVCQIFIEVNALPAIPTILPPGLLCEGVPNVLSIPPTPNNILWNTGATTNSITVYAGGVYTVTLTDPLTGCTSIAQKVVNKRPVVDLFPHFCQKVDCDCIVPFAIYAPRPLVGITAPSPAYAVQWFNSPSNTLITTGISPNGLNYTNLPSGVLTGSYYIKMTDPSTGCTNTSEIYSVTVPTIEECDNCTCVGSSWGPITLTSVKPPIQTTTILCNESQTISCNGSYTLNASYNCLPTGCNSNVTFVMTGPGGPFTGSLPFTFTPSSGTYSISLTGYCDGVACSDNLCEIRFIACPPLEVNLVSFAGKKVEKLIELNWKTASEINNNYYDLEKSEDGSKFVKLAKINAKSANSNEPTDYKFIDEFPFSGVNYYRLKAVDLEGKSSLSKIISVDFTEPAFAKVYPNPTKSDRITIEIPLKNPEKIKLEWFDVLGRSVKTNNLLGNKGQNKFEINVGELPVGKYVIRINLENESKMKNTLNFEKL
jgi:PKD repeat protein